MPEVTIAIEVDSQGAITGARQAETAINQSLNRIAGSGRAAGAGTDQLDKSFARLASSRAPNFLGAVNQQLISQIPLLRQNAAASTLVGTAMFTLTQRLGALVGPVGVILLGVGALAAFASGLFKSDEEAKKLIRTSSELITTLKEFRDLGVNTGVVQLLIKQRIAELEAELGLAQGKIGTFNLALSDSVFAAQGSEQAVSDLTDTYKISNVVADELALKTQRARAELETLKKALAEPEEKFFEVANKQAKEHLALIDKILASQRERQGLGEKFEAGKPAKEIDESMVRLNKGAAEFNDKWREMVQNIKSVQDELKEVDELQKEIDKAAEETRQTFLSLTQPIKQAFVDAFLGVEVNWREMLQRMLAELAISGLFEAIADLFSGSSGGIIGTIGDIFGFQKGTPYVPRTGLAVVHRGEAIIPAEKNFFNRSITNQSFGGNTIIINNYGATAMNRTRLVEDIRRALERREFDI